ncbi:glycosyltransferase [Williamsia sp.]|uniref:glycosyltransferase n=1 Tax=Williamsia sp. TaxID=1872085 RepID=UPI00345164D6
MAGRLLEWKGITVALQSLKIASDADWRLSIYGDGPDRHRFQREAREFGVAGRVSFHGVVPRGDLMSALSTADALLFPSFHDSGPWVVAEAYSLGIPVLCFPQGGASVLAGGNAHIIDVSNPTQSIADIIGGLSRMSRPLAVPVPWGTDRVVRLLSSLYGAS